MSPKAVRERAPEGSACSKRAPKEMGKVCLGSQNGGRPRSWRKSLELLGVNPLSVTG